MKTMKLSNTQKTVIAAVLFTLNTALCLAQWETKYYVDDFGEQTNESYQSLVAYGTFSNSATTNSDAMYVFVKNETSLTINIFEYKRSRATSIEGSFVSVKLKTPSGDIETIDDAFFTKGGSLFFSKEKFTKINNLLTASGDYIMVFSKKSSYSSSDYKIVFSI